MSMKLIVGIDPGINALGFCGLILDGRKTYSMLSEVLRTPAERSTWGKILLLHDKVLQRIQHMKRLAGKNYEDCTCIIERPEVWGTNAESHASAVRGNLIDLAMQVGSLIPLMLHEGFDIKLVSPRKWKGNLPKKVVRHRLAELLVDGPECKLRDHEADAVGIVMNHLGRF